MATLPLCPTPLQGGLGGGPAAKSMKCRKCSGTTAIISARFRHHELHRDQPVWRLCLANVVDVGGRMDHCGSAACAGGPLWSAALRLASILVRVLCLHDRSLFHRYCYRVLRRAMSEVQSRPNEAKDE